MIKHQNDDRCIISIIINSSFNIRIISLTKPLDIFNSRNNVYFNNVIFSKVVHLFYFMTDSSSIYLFVFRKTKIRELNGILLRYTLFFFLSSWLFTFLIFTVCEDITKHTTVNKTTVIVSLGNDLYRIKSRTQLKCLRFSVFCIKVAEILKKNIFFIFPQ